MDGLHNTIQFCYYDILVITILNRVPEYIVITRVRLYEKSHCRAGSWEQRGQCELQACQRLSDMALLQLRTGVNEC